jgi:hypothetical protein
VRHTIGDIGVVVLTPGLGGITVRSISNVPAEELVEFGEAHGPTGRVARRGVARFENVDQRQLAAAVPDRFRLEMEFISGPGE